MFSVLFVADARMSFDNYRSCMVATSDSKTIFTVNPGIISHCIYIGGSRGGVLGVGTPPFFGTNEFFGNL